MRMDLDGVLFGLLRERGILTSTGIQIQLILKLNVYSGFVLAVQISVDILLQISNTPLLLI